MGNGKTHVRILTRTFAQNQSEFPTKGHLIYPTTHPYRYGPTCRWLGGCTTLSSTLSLTSLVSFRFGQSGRQSTPKSDRDVSLRAWRAANFDFDLAALRG
jgi:hypothetical protein